MSELEAEVNFSMTPGLSEIAVFLSDVVAFVIQAIFICVFELFNAICTVFIARRKPKSVSGKLALITGAGRGLGREIALKLSKLGCKIAVVDINGAEAKSVAEEIRQTGVEARSFKTDIAKSDEVEKLREAVAKQMGQVDLLICNAGLIPDQAEDEVSVDFLKNLVEVNVYGTILVSFFVAKFGKLFNLSNFKVVKTFLEEMKRNNSGHIVAISSMAAICPSPFCVEYSATKAAINSYMKALGEKLRLNKINNKILTTCICPFYVTSRKDIVNFLNPK